MPVTLKNRYIHALPGRVRIEVYGLKGSGSCLQQLTAFCAAVPGIVAVKGCVDTGRVLINYEAGMLSLYKICQLISRFEEQQVLRRHPAIRKEETVDAAKEVAATAEAAMTDSVIPQSYQVMPVDLPEKREPFPLAPTVAVVGMGALGIKQLISGKSAFATHQGLFYAAGALSVITGYPLIKRGSEKLFQEGRLSADLVLGTAALALALVRENLLALAATGIIQYLQWERARQQEPNLDPSLYLSARTKAYAKRATVFGFGLAGAALALTRNPLLSLGVLLSANPRPCVAAEEYAWKNAEHTLRQKGRTLPANRTLCSLAEVDHLLVEDTSLVFTKEESNVACVTDGEEEKIWGWTASLLEKTAHPLRQRVVDKANQLGRTRRTAFHVEEQVDGVKGVINGQEYALGSKSFMQRLQIDCTPYDLEAKRQSKKGCVVYYLGRQGKCIGLIVSNCPVHLQQTGQTLRRLQQKVPALNVSFLADSLGVKETLREHGWSMVAPEQRQPSVVSGEKSLLITKTAAAHPGLAAVPVGELSAFEELIVQAKAVAHTADQNRRWTAIWNVAGTAFLLPGRLSAPLANLISDALKLVFLTRSHQATAREQTTQTNPARKAGTTARDTTTDWHALPDEEILRKLGTQAQVGLSAEDVRKLRSKYGFNVIQPAAKSHWLVSFVKQFTEFTTLILLGTAAASILSGDVFDGLAMTFVLAANAVISTVQERKASKVVDALNQFQPPMCRVIRSNETTELPASELVPGDIVLLEAGDHVPADVRLLADWNLEVNESALTGESIAVKKSAGIVARDAELAERTNMLYMGTHIIRGKATGVVVHTGMATQIGHLTSLLLEEAPEPTPLQQKADSISKMFVKGAIAVGSLVFGVGILRGNSVRQMIATSVSLIASAIPEGLPVTITIALSAGIYRMAKRNAVIKKLSALETLGRVTVICSDKTGTLTKNEMTVTKLATLTHSWDVTGEGYSPEGEIRTESGEAFELTPELQKLIEIGLFCNNSQLIAVGDHWQLKGDPTEGALLTLARKAGFREETLARWKRKHEIPFDSANGTMGVVCDEEAEAETCYLMSKGSIEAILKKCSSYQKNGDVYPLTDDVREQILRQNEQYAAQALRVLGFAYRPLPRAASYSDAIEQELIYVGMAGMMDPPKPEVEQVLAEAFRLGVKPVMITGDHPITAIAIGKKLGMFREGDRVISGVELDWMDDQQLVSVVNQVSIFARVTPEHKLRIVQAYRRAGHIVAMTGDGVNDAPAIKAAHVGIAMGRTGTEVTKQSADMVLKEDHFNSILDGVKEGRTIISNIRKAIGCLLTGNLAEILVSSLAVIAGLPIPLLPIQILLMNLLTDALPAAVLAVNPGNKKLVTEKQEIVDSHLYKKVAVRGLVLGLGSLALFASSIAMGASLPVARTMAFASLVAGQLIQTFSWRQENGQHFRHWIKDRFFLGSLGVSWLALLSVIYVPALARLFHTAPLHFHQLVQVLAVGGMVSLLSRPLIAVLTGAAAPVPVGPTPRLQSA